MSLDEIIMHKLVRPAKGVTLSFLAAVSSAVVSILLAVVFPSIPARWSHQVMASQAATLSAHAWRPVGDTSVTAGTGALTTATGPGLMRWYGAVATVKPCDYEVSLDARWVATPGSPSGYAIGPGVAVNAGGVPHGRAFQYDGGFHAVRTPLFPYDSADNQSGYIDPITHFTDGTPVQIDGSWHRWAIRVRDGAASATVDGHVLGSIETGSECARSLYLRVWNGTAMFRDITVREVGGIFST
ncbi:MAG: hypothetical protein ACJ74U_13605 [Jatrophihabitantaceae bacterium]